MHLFFAEGARWKRLRALMNPSFSTSSLRKMYPTVQASASEVMRLLAEKAAASPEGEVNIHS